MNFEEAVKLINSRHGIHMVKADILFLSEYEKSSPYWKNIFLALKIIEKETQKNGKLYQT